MDARNAQSSTGHYEYDAPKIKSLVGRYTDFVAHGHGMGGQTHGVGWGQHNYHPGKRAGDLTDAGEVALMLLEHLAATRGQYDFDAFEQHWYNEITRAGYGSCNFQSAPQGVCPPNSRPGYLNGATRHTLHTLSQYPEAQRPRGEARKRVAAQVNCLVAATHFLPLFLVESRESELVAAAVSTVYLSHSHADPVAAAEFLARTVHRIVYARMPLDAAVHAAAAATGSEFISARVREAVAKVAEANDPNSDLYKHEFVDDVAITSLARLWDFKANSPPIKVGKASPTEGALPAALYFALKYRDSLENALIANAGVGGDSAVRAVVIGTLLGAVHGESALPARWLATLNSRAHAQSLMQQLASLGDEQRAHTEL